MKQIISNLQICLITMFNDMHKIASDRGSFCVWENSEHF